MERGRKDKIGTMRTGLYGGSFDPIHAGHIAAAEAVLNGRALDRVLLLPAGEPPHKPRGCVASFADRVAMARLAVAPIHGLEVADWEGHRPGPSYTRDSVVEAKTRFPHDTFELLVGADMLADLPRWMDAKAIVKNVTIAAFARPGQLLSDALAVCLEGLPEADVHTVKIPLVEASSSNLRVLLGAGEATEAILPRSVAQFIEERGLYGG
jgi:nicotinate-nucleotide adenylyltransferase